MLMMQRQRGLIGLVLSLCGAFGCARSGSDALVIATPWAESEQRAIEAQFHHWSGALAGEAISITWIRLDPGEELERVVERDPRIDVLLGGAASGFRGLAATGRLDPIERMGLPLWFVVRRSPIGWAVNTAALAARGVELPTSRFELSDSDLRGQVAFDDPRSDPVCLALAQRWLESGDWARGYAELVRTAGNARPIGRGGGSARASVERGEAAVAPAVVAESADAAAAVPAIALVPVPDGPELVEGAAIVRGTSHAEPAQAFLQFLADERSAVPVTENPATNEGRVKSLLADLLGATLVDAQVELRSAWARLARQSGSNRAEAEAWLTEAPPWPPASVELIRQTDEPGTLVETLAEQLVPDPAARAWLLDNWQHAPRSMDGALLVDLANALDGRLADEPRFRAWLRAEWTAWASQRYWAFARSAEVPVP
jgi:ABC-type Fe3+ transport system substrate-binding protein